MKLKRSQITPYLLLTPVHIILLLIIGLPSIYIFWLSLNQSSWGTSLKFVGFENYAVIFADLYFWRATFNTFAIVLGVVYTEMLLGLGLASLFVRGVPFKKFLFSMVLMPYAISPVVGVLIWKTLMDPNIGMISRTLPLLGLGTFNWSVNPTHGLFLI